MFWMFLLGCFVGVFWMCMFQINRDHRKEDDYDQEKR